MITSDQLQKIQQLLLQGKEISIQYQKSKDKLIIKEIQKRKVNIE